MKGVAERIATWLCAPADARTAAAVRIGFGCIWLLMLWDVYPAMDLLLDGDGVRPPSTGPEAVVFDALGTYGWFWLSVAAAAATVLGLATRVAVITTFGLMMAFQQRNPYFLSGADIVLRHIGLWLIFLDCGRAWALDSRRRAADQVRGWPLRAIQIQVAIIYLSAFMHKIGTETWQDGSAMYYALSASDLANRAGEWLLGLHWLLRPMTYAVLAVELLVPPLLFIPTTRRAALLLAVILHLGIDAVMSVRFFGVSMLLGFAAFLEARDWQLVARMGRSRRAPPPAESSP